MNREAAGSSRPWKRLIAELAVIVTGVLIALGADSWWEQRHEHRRAVDYLQQLLNDFQQTERHIKNAIGGDTRKFESASRRLEKPTSRLIRLIQAELEAQ